MAKELAESTICPLFKGVWGEEGVCAHFETETKIDSSCLPQDQQDYSSVYAKTNGGRKVGVLPNRLRVIEETTSHCPLVNLNVGKFRVKP